MTDKITSFTGEYRFLSNFYPCSITYHHYEFKSAESVYQAMKSTNIDDYKRFVNLTAQEAKILGRNIKIRSDWEQEKLFIMKTIVQAKFDQNPDLRKKLIETKDMILEEGNWWGDRYWGISPEGSDQGENHLGKILMSLREYYRDVYFGLGWSYE